MLHDRIVKAASGEIKLLENADASQIEYRFLAEESPIVTQATYDNPHRFRPMELISRKLPMLELTGTARSCGRKYGALQAEMMAGFMELEGLVGGKHRQLAAHCWREIMNWQPAIAEFMRGVAEGCERSVEEIALLSLHEEVVHSTHCTAFGAAGDATNGRGAIIGQNWDWSPRLYPWSSLLKMKTDTAPAALSYAYPGLWACAGLNEHGLSLVWTGSGYYPNVPPKVGIPTYALIAAILQQKDCGDAIRLLKRTKNAGCFIFFLADADGDVNVVEGWPESVYVSRCESVIGRANHYLSDEARRSVDQQVPMASIENNTVSRCNRVMELLELHKGRIDGATAQAILRDHGVKRGLDICQHPTPGRESITLDSFYLLPAKRELWLARGLPCRHQYERFVL